MNSYIAKWLGEKPIYTSTDRREPELYEFIVQGNNSVQGRVEYLNKLGLPQTVENHDLVELVLIGEEDDYSVGKIS